MTDKKEAMTPEEKEKKTYDIIYGCGLGYAQKSKDRDDLYRKQKQRNKYLEAKMRKARRKIAELKRKKKEKEDLIKRLWQLQGRSIPQEQQKPCPVQSNQKLMIQGRRSTEYD